MNNIRIELGIPILYTLERYRKRHDSNWATSVVAYFSSMLRDYMWIPIYIFLVTDGPFLFQLSGLLLHLLAFSIIYEAGYLYTDNISVKKENVKIRKVIYKEALQENHVYFAMLLRVIVVGIMFLFMQPWLSLEIIILYLSILAIYYIYGNLQESYRVPLFLLLRFLKGFIPVSFLLLSLESVPTTLISLLLLATASFFTIEYASRKLDLPYINIQLMKYVWVRYLIIFVFLAPYLIFDHIPFRDFSLIFTTYVSIHIGMIVLSLLRKFLNVFIIKELKSILRIF
ncbi:hypothetical protein [Autumnicola edwardsiae]|uniref:Uncharacterized protein n=1 Tax=Autumnicola edwardsiae TaxID=3075594 RepID=A0ABU3CW08_9FLAO|nr:hypothetical protein [Zunongwangia sp. F297]MDT0650413.1 hypothetical protein [Zunongwangia sp. F297]